MTEPAGWLLTWKDRDGTEHTDFSLTKEDAVHTDRQLARYFSRYEGPGLIRPVYYAAAPASPPSDEKLTPTDQVALRSALRASSRMAPASPPCPTCNGRGETGRMVRFGDGEVDSTREPCPECAPASPQDEKLREALREIASQHLHAEITETDPDELDWLDSYEHCVKRARAALGGPDHE